MRAVLKLQGWYMGYVRQLSPRQRTKVKALKAARDSRWRAGWRRGSLRRLGGSTRAPPSELLFYLGDSTSEPEGGCLMPHGECGSYGGVMWNVRRPAGVSELTVMRFGGQSGRGEKAVTGRVTSSEGPRTPPAEAKHWTPSAPTTVTTSPATLPPVAFVSVKD